MKRAISVILVAICFAPHLGNVLGAGEEDIIDVMYVSRGLFQGSVMDRTLSVDPAISVFGIPMPGHYSIGDLGQDPDHMNRVMRLYMPRTYEHMTGKTDAIIMDEAPCGSTTHMEVYFDTKWMLWFFQFEQEDCMSFSMWGGDASWGGGGEGFYKNWGETVLDPILPFEGLGGYNPDYAANNRPHFVDPEHPLARLPWKQAGPVELLNKVETKQGATLVAEALGAGVNYPWIAWWESGKGRSVGETQVFGSMGTTNVMSVNWRWYQDFLIYLVYFASGKPIPEDVYRVHRLREEINIHTDKAILLISLLEFIEKFGASTVQLYEELEELNEVELVAEEHYRRDEYDRVAEIFEDIHLAWEVLNGKAIKVKENALIWVYLIEWLAVSGVSLISGVFLWSVMIRRRLFKTVEATRFR